MKKTFLYLSLFILFCFITSRNLFSSEGFKILNKTKSNLNKESTKKPSGETLQKVANELSKIYLMNFSNDNLKEESTLLSPSIAPFKTTEIKPEELLKRANKVDMYEIKYSEKTNLPIFISLQTFNNKKTTDEILTDEKIFSFLSENKSLFKIENPKSEFQITQTLKDDEGNNHVRLQQYYNSIPIWGKELILHFNNSNELYLINGRTSKSIYNLNTNDNIINQKYAIDICINNLKQYTELYELDSNIKKLLKYDGPQAEKYIWYDDNNNIPHLVWKVEIRPNIIDNWRFFIDANTGEILEKYNTSPYDGPADASGVDALGKTRNFKVFLENGVYYLIDVTKPMFNNNFNNPKGSILTMTNNNKDLKQGITPAIISSPNNKWNDPFSISTHYHSSLIYDYYKNTHNRNSIDDQGMDMLAIIHVTYQNQSFDNAYWNGQFVVLGDGGQMTIGWPPALDFTAHEFTHGVVTFTVDLEYKFQSGALNEGFADWGGCMVDRDDWTMGEDIIRPQAFPSGCMRSLADPHNGGTKGDHIWLPAHMNEYMNLTIDQDNGGVHYNCGIINKVTYLIGNAIGKDKLEKIYYRVLKNKYLTKQAQFIDMRLACIKSAEELFGKNSNEVNVVKNSFDQVGITDGQGTNPTPDLPPVEGNEWIAFVYANDLTLYMAKPVIQNQNTDIKKLTNTRVFSENNGTITVPENGSIILFIDENNNLKAMNSNGTNETYIDNTGVWRTISISPNGFYLAATSVYEEPVIYLFDLKNSTYKTIELYIPTTGDDFDYIEPLFANTMTWDVKNRILVYDALNYKFSWKGGEEYYVDMNAIDASTGVIYRIFPTLGSGISVGSPDFGKTSSNVLTFLVYNDNDGYCYINGANLFDGIVKNIVYANAQQFGLSSPVYSVRDNKIAFQITDGINYAIMQVPLSADKISSSGNPTDYLTNVGIPKWFAIGSRPTEVSENYFQNASIKIFPNPAKEFVEINIIQSTRIDEIVIYNAMGKKCYSVPIQPTVFNYRLNIESLAPGIYYIKVGTTFEKFIKL